MWFFVSWPRLLLPPLLPLLTCGRFLPSSGNKKWGVLSLPLSMTCWVTTSLCSPEVLGMSPSSWETGGKFLLAARPLGSHPELSQFSCHLQDVILSQMRKQEGRRGGGALNIWKHQTQQNLCGHRNYYYAELLNAILSFFGWKNIKIPMKRNRCLCFEHFQRKVQESLKHAAGRPAV